MEDKSTFDKTVLFDTYLRGVMTAEEKTAFEARLDSEPGLREELEFHRRVMESLVIGAENQALKRAIAGIRREMPEKEPGSTIPVKFIAIIIFLLLSVAAGVWYFWTPLVPPPLPVPDPILPTPTSVPKNTIPAPVVPAPVATTQPKQNKNTSGSKNAPLKNTQIFDEEVLLGSGSIRSSYHSYSSGMLLEDTTYQSMESIEGQRGDYDTPPKISLKKYCPAPRDQGGMPMCVAFSITSALSIRLAALCEQENKQTRKVFSASYLYNQIYEGPDCHLGAYLSKGIILAQNQGVCLESTFSTDTTCTRIITEAAKKEAVRYKVTAYYRLFNTTASTEKKLLEIKKSIVNNNPVIVGMLVDKSFQEIPVGGAWQPSQKPEDGHAMVVIGYDDDTKTVELLNSYGTNWGNGGFVSMDYETFGKYLRYGWEISLGRFVYCD